MERDLRRGVPPALRAAVAGRRRRRARAAGLHQPAGAGQDRAHPTASPSAWEEYTAALALLDRVDRPGNAKRAVAHLEAALRADPRFARAHAAVGRAYWMRYKESGDAAWADRARDEVQEALRLAPQEADSRLALALIYEGRGKKAEALEEARRALPLQPNSDEILDFMQGVDFLDFSALLGDDDRAELVKAAELMGQKRLIPVIDRTYPLKEARAAQEQMLRPQILREDCTRLLKTTFVLHPPSPGAPRRAVPRLRSRLDCILNVAHRE